MPNKMLIDASHPEETRVVVTRGNRIEEFDFESQDKKQLRGNIYLARVTRVEPSLQAAFIEYGGNRHGFLAFNEIHPDYYQIPVADRQALLKAEAEAAEAEEAEEENEERGRRRRRGGKGRGRGRSEQKAAEQAETTDAEADAGEEGAAADETETVEAGFIEHDEGNGSVMSESISADVVSEEIGTNGDETDDDRQPGAEENGEAALSDESEVESVGAEDALDEAQHRRRSLRRTYKIQEVIKRRQILLVQVVKEERGNKGAALTTYLSLAGRYSVLMPNTARGGGISRKITNAQDRKRLKDVVKDLDVPQGMGVILRTAGENRTKAEIKRDYEYLMRLWENVRTLTLQSTAPALVYEEGSLIKRSVRDLYNKDIDEILVAGEDGYREAKDFMRMLMPSHAKVVQPYRDPTPIFARNGIEAQLDRMLQPQVTLKSGGYIIINQTEALVAIDVNSGRSTREHSIEDTALQTNLEAAEEVARQLRLRDLAGLIVIDFIDMEENRNNRAVEKKLKECLKNDRARIQVGRISHFGLMEMSRQRIRASVLESTMKPCPHCGGTGHVRSDSSTALHVIRGIEEHLLKDSRHHITVRTPTATALYVLNHKRSNLVELEQRFRLSISVEADDEVGAQHYAITRGAPAEPRPVIETAVEDTPAFEAMDADEELDAAPEERAEHHAHGRAEEESEGHRKRRRRRRRRGGRDHGDEHSRDGEQRSALDAGEAEAPDDAEAAEDAAHEPHPAAAEGAADEHKKRRRGRRGGRRNRRDRGGEHVEEAVGGDETPLEAGAVPAAETAAPAAMPEFAVSEAPVAEAVAEAEPETVAEQAAPEQAQPEKPAKPARRRSRKAAAAESAESATANGAEPALAESGSDIEADTAQAAEPQEEEKPVEPVVVSSTVDEARPRKTGWWQRKSFF
ncbi:MAG: Rne/Rng family ribonuclease [Rhizobiaceae bacterium]